VGGLIRDQYASVGAAGRSALPAALAVLDQAATRGLDVAALRDRIELRSSEIDGYSAAYRAYVKPTDGLSGVTLAPFAVLAGAGVSYADRDHGWHLARPRAGVRDPGRRVGAGRPPPLKRVGVSTGIEQVPAGVRPVPCSPWTRVRSPSSSPSTR
jgi:hypothetical protein